MTRTVYMGGQWVDETDAKVSIYDLSVAQGAAAFEMTRSFGGEHFKLREHLQRLQASCAALDIPLAYTLDELEALCHEVTVRNLDAFAPEDEHRLMIVASPGCPPMYKDLAGTIYGPWVYIADFPLRYTVHGMARYFDEGVNLRTVGVRQVNSSAIPAIAKHRSRQHFHQAQLEAYPDWALLLDDSGTVCEGPGFNVLVVVHGVLWQIDRGHLEGISQDTACQLARDCGVEVKVGLFSPAALQQATEVWVTGTPFCILPVGCVDGKLIGDGTPGPIYKQVLTKWSQQVGVDIANQIKSWEGYPCGQSVLSSGRVSEHV